MKRILIGALAAGIVLGVPAVAVAATYTLPWTKNIYNVSDPDEKGDATVSTFTDGDTKCYVVNYQSWNRNNYIDADISCVKK